jgi:FecR protein
MRLQCFVPFAGFLLAAILSAPAFAADAGAQAALPGTLNYVEGQVSIGTRALGASSIGSTVLLPGQSLTTENGKAEVLLTPGVFLRLGTNTSVKMISPGLTDTEVELDQGHAMVEVAEIHPENDIRISQHGVIAQLVKTGLYDFDADRNQIRVFDGQAYLEQDDRRVKVKSGREVSLGPEGSLKAVKFEKDSYSEDDLYRWSSLRSAYVAEANVDAAGMYAEYGYGPWGLGWWGSAWYWDPWFDTFAFIPADGIFFSPFGWGFYSPWCVTSAPYWGRGYGFYHHRFTTNVHNLGPGNHYVISGHYANGTYHGPASTGAFHSGPRMTAGNSFFRGFGRGGSSAGGGFHGGAGGFHGGGGGGFHGGGGGGGGRGGGGGGRP